MNYEIIVKRNSKGEIRVNGVLQTVKLRPEDGMMPLIGALQQSAFNKKGKGEGKVNSCSG